MATEIRIITIEKIAEMVKKVAETVTLPNGGTRTGLNWKPSDLQLVEAALKPLSQTAEPTLVDGMGPQWLIANIVHALHPCLIRLGDPKVEGASVALSFRKPGVAAGELTFIVTETEKAVMVEYSSEAPISANSLPDLVPPATPQGKPVVLSGRTATWAVAQIAMGYAHHVPAVFINQPGVGFVCAITHSETYKVGDVFQAIEEIPALPKMVELQKVLLPFDLVNEAKFASILRAHLDSDKKQFMLAVELATRVAVEFRISREGADWLMVEYVDAVSNVLDSNMLAKNLIEAAVRNYVRSTENYAHMNARYWAIVTLEGHF